MSRLQRWPLAVVPLASLLALSPALSQGTKSAEAPKPGAPKQVEAKLAGGNDLKPGTERKNPKDGALIVYVPPAEFEMGADDGYENEKPKHKVKLSKGFWIYKTEVTNAQYAKFLAANPKQPKLKYWTFPQFKAPDQPVVGVTWEAASAYCKWVGARLPTEAEWEYAARGTEARKFPWGKENPDPTRAIFALDSAAGKPGPVGKLDPGAGPFGTRDMAGNVWEWCADWYDTGYYKASPPADPAGPAQGTERIARGGSWFSPWYYLRGTYRMRYAPGEPQADVGFRPVVSGP